MNRLKTITLAGLFALDVAAAAFAWRAISGAETMDRLPVRSASSIVPSAVADAPAVTRGDDPETIARPLFAQSRRPSRRGSAEASAAPPPAGLKLRAVIGFNHSVRAFVTSSAAADGKWLSAGEMFENWTVDSIAAQEVALRQGMDVVRVGFDYDFALTPAGPVPEPSPPAKAENGDEPPVKIKMPPAFLKGKDGKRGEH